MVNIANEVHSYGCWLLYRHTCCYYQLHITSSLLIVTMEKDESKSIFNYKKYSFLHKCRELLFTVRYGCTRLSRGVRGGGMVVLLGGHTYPESLLLLSMSSEEDEEV